MDRQAKDNPLPRINGLDKVEAINNQFFLFLKWLDEEEHKLVGDDPFPFDDINTIGTLQYDVVCQYSKVDIEGTIWQGDYAISRIDIQINRIDQVLGWIENKLNKITALIPRDVIAFMDKEERLHRMALAYPVVGVLMENREEYLPQQLQWRNVSRNLERKVRMLWHLLAKKENKNG